MADKVETEEKPDPNLAEADKDNQPADDADKDADKGGKDASDDGGDSIFDGLDDDSKGKDQDKPKGKQKAEESPDKSDKTDKDADAKGKQDGKPDGKPEGEDGDAEDGKDGERLAPDTKWRDRLADRILAGQKDKLSAAKFEKRREAVVTQLKRFKSMDDAVYSGFSAMEKIRSGDHKKPPENASETDLAGWRKDNDIPEKPEDYVIPKISGYELTEKDEPAIESFRSVAHGMNITQTQAKALIEWKLQQDLDAQAEYDSQLKKQDRADKEACNDALRSEYGIAEFKPHLKVAERLLGDDEVFGEEAKTMILTARYYDTESGTWHRLTSNPAVMRGLISMALDRYGEGASVPTDVRTKNDNRRAELEKLRSDNYDEYVRTGGADELLAIAQKEEERASKRGRR